jgi:hypothetical protein
MSSSNRRKWSGLWLLGILGAIGSIMGIRYASSEGWWSNMMNREELAAYQTVNTGASVSMAGDGSQPTLGGSSTGPLDGSPTDASLIQGGNNGSLETGAYRGRW